MLGVFRPRGDARGRRVAVAGRAEGGARGRRGHRSTNGHDPGGEPQRTRTSWREMHTHRVARNAHARGPRTRSHGGVGRTAHPGERRNVLRERTGARLCPARTTPGARPSGPCTLLGETPGRGRACGARVSTTRKPGGSPGPGRRPGGRGGPRGAGVWPLRLLGCTGKVPAFGEDAWGPSHFNRKSAQDREPSRCSPERPRGDAGSAPAASDQVPRGRRHGHAPPQEAQGTGSARVPQTRRAEPKPGAGRPQPTTDGGGGGRPELPLPPSLALHQRTSPTPRTARRSRHPGRDACVTVVRHS